MERAEESAYISKLFKKALENSDLSVDLLNSKLCKIENRIRNRIDVVLRQLSILQREESELDSIFTHK